jgi:alkanesulfonate monooxygenase SsuD/methylene tetrahydromethanopterin reductase-like flavin-dependent oxidoreductase (luciferase family)
MEFGLMHEFQPAASSLEADTFARSLEQIDAAEKLGLDVIWLADLHSAPQLSVLSSPLTVAAAIAARTRRMKIGTAVQVLPLHHPLRLAEDVATVDHLSGGRFIFGVGRSNYPGAYKAFGIPYAESRERLFEMLEVLKLAWTEPDFSYRGAYHAFSKVTVVPKPLQKPHPPIRVAVESVDSAVAVARLGHPVFVSVRIGTFSDLAPLIRAYRDAYRASGHAGEGAVYLRVPLYLAESDERAREEAQASVTSFFQHVAELLDWSARRPDGQTDQRRRERAGELRAMSYDQALRDHAVIGSAGAVSTRLCALHRQLGLDGVLAELNCGGAIPHDRVMAALELLCRDVTPRVKERTQTR